MIPSRTTFHVAVGAFTHVMQRRMVAGLATRQLSLGEGSVGAALGGGVKSDFAAPAGNVVRLHLSLLSGSPVLNTAAVPADLPMPADFQRFRRRFFVASLEVCEIRGTSVHLG